MAGFVSIYFTLVVLSKLSVVRHVRSQQTLFRGPGRKHGETTFLELLHFVGKDLCIRKIFVHCYIACLEIYSGKFMSQYSNHYSLNELGSLYS